MNPSSLSPSGHTHDSIRQVSAIDRSRVDPSIIEAAEGMESLFIEYMLKVMRETVPENELGLESPATKIYRGMLDGEIAKQAAHAGGMGLGDQIIAYLEARRYNQGRAPEVTQRNGGGAHEGR